MKRVITIFILFQFSIVTAYAMNQTLSLGATEWPPYMLEKSEKGNGLLVDITKASLKAVGIELKVEFLPWPRAMLMLENGEIDSMTSVSYTEKRAGFAIYPETPVFITKMIFVHNKNRNDISSGH